jgi:hypothetical protein
VQLPTLIAAMRRQSSSWAKPVDFGNITASAFNATPTVITREVPSNQTNTAQGVYSARRIAEDVRFQAYSCNEDPNGAAGARYWCPCWDRMRGFTGRYACCTFNAGQVNPQACNCEAAAGPCTQF